MIYSEVSSPSFASRSKESRELMNELNRNTYTERLLDYFHLTIEEAASILRTLFCERSDVARRREYTTVPANTVILTRCEQTYKYGETNDL